ncbi:MAG: hypothetical protein UZ18_ATM001000378 [Armatimonadetes bacterium OLB18]|nr:MAG: hypothetical protein UZ18_ATM001000378 [Armatimonadetes bacterium OLB18]
MNHRLASVAIVDRGRERDGHPLLVDDRKVGRMLAFSDRGHPRAEVGRRGSSVACDAAVELLGVLLRREPPDRHLVEVRVSKVLRSVGKGPLHRLDKIVRVLSRPIARLLKVVMLEDVEHLEEGDPPRTWRRHAEDLIASVGSHDRLSPNRAIRLEVRESDESAVGGHVFGDQLRGLARIELARTLVAYARQSAPKVVLNELLAPFVRLPVPVEDPIRFGKRLEGRHLTPQASRQARRQFEALRGELARRFDHIAPSQLAKPAVRLPQTCDRSRNSRGKPPYGRASRNGACVGTQVHVPSRAARRPFAKVERIARTVGHPDHHEPAAAQIPSSGQSDGESERRGDGRIDRVSSFSQDLRPDL